MLPRRFRSERRRSYFAVDGTSYQKVASGLVEEWQGKGFQGGLMQVSSYAFTSPLIVVRNAGEIFGP